MGKPEHPIYNCLWELRIGNMSSFSAILKENPDTAVSSYCKNNCTNETGFMGGSSAPFCDRIVFGPISGMMNILDFVYLCEEDKFHGENVHATKLCDGSHDCKNSAEELGCPGRFYCSNKAAVWIEEARVCDHVKDCANGADECETCNFGKSGVARTFESVLYMM